MIFSLEKSAHLYIILSYKSYERLYSIKMTVQLSFNHKINRYKLYQLTLCFLVGLML